MHVFQGHYTKMTEEVTQDIREFSEDGEWPKRMRTCKEDLNEKQAYVEVALPLDVLGESKTLKKRLTYCNGRKYHKEQEVAKRVGIRHI